jgi:F-type H+-transporting ATPase subunit delta
MQNESLARRYATAVYALAAETGDLARVGNDMASIAAAIGSDVATREFYVAPTIERSRKEQALLGVFSGRVSEIALHTLLLLVRKRRENLLEAIVAEFRKLEMSGRGVEPLVIASALELGSDDVRGLVEPLERAYGKKFEPTVRRDSSLIGGVRITMGDRVIDGSVAGRLEDLTRTLFSAGT